MLEEEETCPGYSRQARPLIGGGVHCEVEGVRRTGPYREIRGEHFGNMERFWDGKLQGDSVRCPERHDGVLD